MSYTIVIPSRFASSRLPGKPLLDICGKTMIERVYIQACQTGAERVVVATDDQRIADEVQKFGGEWVMTSDQHNSGTDRLAEVVDMLAMDREQILVNVQGDEPLIPPNLIDQVASNLKDNSNCACATLAEKIVSIGEFMDPSVVKVIANDCGEAIYFSRAPIPFPRDHFVDLENADGDNELPEFINAHRHIGIYAYRASTLSAFSKWPEADIERVEALEQLRILFNGGRIHVAVAVTEIPGGVDTREDLQRVQNWISANE